jgi:hypothetical protein
MSDEANGTLKLDLTQVRTIAREELAPIKEQLDRIETAIGAGSSVEPEPPEPILPSPPPPPPPPSPPPPSGTGLGYRIGFYGPWAEFTRMEGLLQRKMDQSICYVNRYGGWGSSGGGYCDLGGAFNLPDKLAHVPYVTIQIPTLLNAGVAGGTTMPASAAGQYDQYYVNLARALAPYKDKILGFSVNWEFNGFWMNHGVSSNSSGGLRWQPNDFIQSFRRLATILKQECAGVPIVWTLNNGPDFNLPTGRKAIDYYPGDDVVDAIGLDLYERNWQNFANAKSAGGLDYVDSFLNAHPGKRCAFPEWGAFNNDGNFITQMAAWFKVRKDKVLWETYWNSQDGGQPGTNLAPGSALEAAYVNAYKGTAY